MGKAELEQQVEELEKESVSVKKYNAVREKAKMFEERANQRAKEIEVLKGTIETLKNQFDQRVQEIELEAKKRVKIAINNIDQTKLELEETKHVLGVQVEVVRLLEKKRKSDESFFAKMLQINQSALFDVE